MEHFGLQNLVQLVPPPKDVVGIPRQASWDLFERELGTKLPDDFKDLVATYGAGSFSDFIWLHSPAVADNYWNLPKVVANHLEAYRIERNPGDLAYPVYPEPDGLLPWTYTFNGDVICWCVSGSNENWPVVVNESRSNHRFERFEEGATSFIFKCLSGQLKPKAFPDNAFESIFFRPLDVTWISK
jgi:hypothetical protein